MKTLITEGVVFSDAENVDADALKQLWLICFPDVKTAVDMFFENIFDPSRCFIAKHNEAPVAMLFLIPCTLGAKKAHYLYAACTKPEFRCKGIMGSLIEFALDKARKFGDSFSLLLPATADLYGYYKKLGYSRGPVLRTKEVFIHEGAESKTSFPHSDEMLAWRDEAFKDNAHLAFGENVISHAVAINSLYGGKTVISGRAYAIVSAQIGDSRIILETTADKKNFPALMKKIRYECKTKKYILRLPFKNNIDDNCRIEEFGMIRPLDGSEIPENIFIGLTLE